MKKILLIADVAPSKQKTGGIVLSQLCRFLPKGSIACFILIDHFKFPRIDSDLDWIPIKYYHKYIEYIRSLFPHIFYNIVDKIHNRIVLNNLVSFAKKVKAEAVWCVLESITSIQIARLVSQTLRIPLLTEIWDPPEWWILARKINQSYAAKILQEFDNVLKSSQACATASWSMAKEYYQKYGVKTIPFLPSIEVYLALPPAQKPHDNKLVIALAGQIYATEEWSALLAALNSVKWVINNRGVEILLLGRFDYKNIRYQKNIKIIGWQTQEKTIKHLSNSDILYCPYWFSKTFEKVSRLSFPSKLTTYFAAGRPVLFHGPPYASPAKFLKMTSSGFCCYSLNSNDIISAISKIITDNDLYARLTRNGKKTLERYLAITSLRENFMKFIQSF